jgi:hypothetical protein
MKICMCLHLRETAAGCKNGPPLGWAKRKQANEPPPRVSRKRFQFCKPCYSCRANGGRLSSFGGWVRFRGGTVWGKLMHAIPTPYCTFLTDSGQHQSSSCNVTLTLTRDFIRTKYHPNWLVYLVRGQRPRGQQHHLPTMWCVSELELMIMSPRATSNSRDILWSEYLV